MNLLYTGGALADSSSNAFDTTAPDITNSEDSRTASFEGLSCVNTASSSERHGGRAEIKSRSNKSLLIERNATVKPLGARYRAHHQKNVLNPLFFDAAVSLPRHRFQMLFALQLDDLGARMQDDIWDLLDPSDQILRHAPGQPR